MAGEPSERPSGCEIVFAVLAHDSPECLAQQLEILNRLVPGSKCIVFDSSPSRSVTSALGILPCAGSVPLDYGRLAPFHVAAMRAAAELGSYEFLVTMDSDMLLLRPGFPDYLRRVMGDAEYMAPHFRRVPWWLRSDSHRRFRYCWGSYWRNLLGASHPYRVLNCFQVYRRGLVSRILAYDKIDTVVEATLPARTALVSLEELIYPTLAVSLGANPVAYPGSYCIHTGRLSIAEFATFRDDPDVVVAHTGIRDAASPVWKTIRAFSLGEDCDLRDEEGPPVRRSARDRVRSLMGRAAQDAKVLAAIAYGTQY